MTAPAENGVAERHTARMARKKAVIDARIATAQDARGVLVVNTGNGKGKSSAAFGVVARALGHGCALPATASAYAARFACLLGSALPTPPRCAWHPQCGAGSFRSRLAQLDRWWLV